MLCMYIWEKNLIDTVSTFLTNIKFQSDGSSTGLSIKYTSLIQP